LLDEERGCGHFRFVKYDLCQLDEDKKEVLCVVCGRNCSSAKNKKKKTHKPTTCCFFQVKKCLTTKLRPHSRCAFLFALYLEAKSKFYFIASLPYQLLSLCYSRRVMPSSSVTAFASSTCAAIRIQAVFRRFKIQRALHKSQLIYDNIHSEIERTIGQCSRFVLL
jgi:hypothetical protein